VRVWLLEPLRASDPYFSNFLSCSFCCFHCLSDFCSFHPPSLHHQLPCFVRTCLFWAFSLLLLGRTSLFVLVSLDSAFLFSQRVGARVCLSITYPSPSLDFFSLFQFHDDVHTPSPLFPSPPLVTSTNPLVLDGPDGTSFPINYLSLFYRCSHHPFPCFGIRQTYFASNLHASLSITRRHPTPLPS